MTFDRNHYPSSRAKQEERQQKAEETYNKIKSYDSLSTEQFITAISGSFGCGMGERYGQLIVDYDLWETAIVLAAHPDPKVAFRSSWALEYAYTSHRQKFVEQFFPMFITAYLTSTNGSVHRSYTKMLCDILRRKLTVPEPELLEKIAEKAFDLLINPETKVAVKVWAEEILFDLTPKLPWIGEHLEDIIRAEMEKDSATPAMLNHGSKILKKIKKRRLK